ncbi:MAG TPA: TIGR03435 family protein [Bryobacteraceae bacterium]|nr:TIGR03435 family protein [Bryobacteraceae bacterium]
MGLPVYALVVGKHGAKFHPTTLPDNQLPFGMRIEPGELIGHKMSMQQLIGALLNSEAGRQVVDQTGLTGRYDLKLTWAPEKHSANPLAENNEGSNNGPSLFTALEDQLGLKLVPQKAPVEVLVIDHIERPSPN